MMSRANIANDRRGVVTPLALMLLVVIAISATATFRAFAHGQREQRQTVLKSQLSAIEASAAAWVRASETSFEKDVTLPFTPVDSKEEWESVVSRLGDDSVNIVSRITIDGKTIGRSETNIALSESKSSRTTSDDGTGDESDAAPEEKQKTITASENEDSE